MLSRCSTLNFMVHFVPTFHDLHENCLLFKTPQPSAHLRANFFYFLDLGSPILNEPNPHPLHQTMEEQPHHAWERTKSKQKQNQVMSHSNWPRVLLFVLTHKQCNDIIKGWLHCFPPESIGRILVSNILSNFLLLKKK